MISWKTCRRDFEPDGALRDIYVCDTSMDDWRIVFETLRRHFRPENQLDYAPSDLPVTVDEVFESRDALSPLLRFPVGRVLIACHLFTPEEVAFDFDPRDVTTRADRDQLLAFLQRLGDTTGKPASWLRRMIPSTPLSRTCRQACDQV